MGMAAAAVACAAAAALASSPSVASDSRLSSSTQGQPMRQSILVHLTHGPEHPTRAALAFAVAAAAAEQGHSVTVFLAGDAVQLMREGVLDNLNGLGTGNLRELYDRLSAAGVPFHLSGGSSRARGLGEADLSPGQARFSGPPELVSLALQHDRMFTY